MQLDGARVAVQGFGNVGNATARLMSEAGAKVVAVSDAWGGIYNKNGLDIARLIEHVAKTGRVMGFAEAESIAKARELLAVATPKTEPEAASTQQSDQPRVHPRPCPCCGGRMIVIEVFARGGAPRHKPSIDTS